MNTVRITFSADELMETIGFLRRYTDNRTPAQVRLASCQSEQGKVVAQLIPTLCARLAIRLSTAQLMHKAQYKLNLPSEHALALVHAWLETGGNNWPRARVLIGNLHQHMQ